MAVRVLRFTQTPALRQPFLLLLRRSRTDFFETADPFGEPLYLSVILGSEAMAPRSQRLSKLLRLAEQY
jgi:hypothetical protein